MSSTTRRALSDVALTAAILALTACSQGSATNTGAASSSGGVTITYMNFSANGGHEKDLQAIADAFHQENPEITVKIETVPYDSYFTKLQTAVAGGTASESAAVPAATVIVTVLFQSMKNPPCGVFAISYRLAEYDVCYQGCLKSG